MIGLLSHIFGNMCMCKDCACQEKCCGCSWHMHQEQLAWTLCGSTDSMRPQVGAVERGRPTQFCWYWTKTKHRTCSTVERRLFELCIHMEGDM